MSQRKPNILFLMSDEHRADFAGFAGDPVARTPRLDELARTGVVFTNAYTPSPICVPSRQCLASGQLPMTNGCTGWIDLPPGAPTFARVLGHHGYETVCCGKLHHHGQDQMQGWRLRPGGDMEVGDLQNDVGGYTPADPWRYADYAELNQAHELRIAGVGQGPWEARDEIALKAAEYCIDHLQYFGNSFFDWQHEDPLPALLKFSLCNPHYPYFTDQEKFDYYLRRCKPFTENQPFDHPILGRTDAILGETHNLSHARRATACYYGMIETMDQMYGQVMDHLTHRGEDLDDWWIIYTSDHGEMLGEHACWEKQKFFEASTKIPLVIRPPKALREEWDAAGRVVTENVNLIDLFATLCEAGSAPPLSPEHGCDSRSLMPLMRGETQEWHERYHNESISQFFVGPRERGATPEQSHLMIKRDALKYQFYGSPDGECAPEVLFDLEADPKETRNRINDPEYADALVTLRARRDALGFGPHADADYCNAGY